uniref:Uncharacterized protein n=1 Tax=Leersia perrieri TaxID=77586 RepID=A0A0D9XN55_9ORYZ
MAVTHPPLTPWSSMRAWTLGAHAPRERCHLLLPPLPFLPKPQHNFLTLSTLSHSQQTRRKTTLSPPNSLFFPVGRRDLAVTTVPQIFGNADITFQQPGVLWARRSRPRELASIVVVLSRAATAQIGVVIPFPQPLATGEPISCSGCESSSPRTAAVFLPPPVTIAAASRHWSSSAPKDCTVPFHPSSGPDRAANATCSGNPSRPSPPALLRLPLPPSTSRPPSCPPWPPLSFSFRARPPPRRCSPSPPAPLPRRPLCLGH